MKRVTTACAAVLAACCLARGAEPLARYFPRRDLVVYAEFDGLDAHAEAWHKTAAARVLNETAAGAMLETVLAQILQRALESDPNVKLTGKETLTLAEHAFRHGFAFGINRQSGTERPSCIGLVLRGAARGEARAIVGRLIDAGNSPATRSESVGKPGGRKVIVVTEARAGRRGPKPAEPQGFAWWAEGDDLVFSLVSPGGADAMIAALEHERPNAVEEPTRAALAKTEDGFEPIGLAFFDMAALPQLPPQAASLGLDRIKRLDYRWGFDGEALMTVSRIVAPAPRAGLLALFDQPAFDTRKLPPLPSGLAGFAVFSFAPGRFFDTLVAVSKATDPNAAVGLDRFEQAATGHSLRKDILGRLGPLMVAYTVPTRINAPTNALEGLAQGLVHVPKSSLAIQVDDVKAFGPVLDDVVKRFNEAQKGRGGDAPAAEFKPLKGHEHGYVLSASPAALTLPAGMRPTVALGRGSLILATTPEAARLALAQETKPGGLPAGDPLAVAIEHVPPRVTFLTVTDTKNSMLADVVANLPGLVQLVASSREGNGKPLEGLLNNGLPALLPIPRRTVRDLRVGTPGAPSFRLRIDPDDVPAPDDLRPYLFPGTFAMTADDEGIRMIARESFPAFNPTTAAPIAAALMLPAIQSARSAARRAQSVNNLKQIGLAMHNFASANNRLPAPIRDKGGRPLLSWRVAILPFLEQGPLFNEFHLDEPWDSPHNKELIERMPTVYEVPSSKAEPGMTFYRGFAGKGTLFDPERKEGIGFADVTDGTSNTIGVVEAREAVPWTKPDGDIPLDPDPAKIESMRALLGQLGGHFPQGFNALFLDGSVRFLKDTINLATLRALITRDGGEVVSSDSF